MIPPLRETDDFFADANGGHRPSPVCSQITYTDQSASGDLRQYTSGAIDYNDDAAEVKSKIDDMWRINAWSTLESVTVTREDVVSNTSGLSGFAWSVEFGYARNPRQPARQLFQILGYSLQVCMRDVKESIPACTFFRSSCVQNSGRGK